MGSERKPSWLKKRIPPYKDVIGVKSILVEKSLHTVCEEALCPNIGECFSRSSATFLILGRRCTRSCRFCAIENGIDMPVDEGEPKRVADAVKMMNLKYVVITSVSRDDLTDGGASHFAKTIKAIRMLRSKIRVEVLIPDFKGDLSSLKTVLNESPDVLNHNIETVERLYPSVRPEADYRTSLNLLKMSKQVSPSITTKSGFMLGLGEDRSEVLKLMKDLRDMECDILTIGQYLQPRRDRLPVVRYIPPEEFAELKRIGIEMGFKALASGPFVRSSYCAVDLFLQCGYQSFWFEK